MFYMARKRNKSEAHLEVDLILSVLELALQVGTVDDVGDGVADISPHGVVEVVLLNDRNMGAHSDDAGVDGLAVEVFVALLIHVGLAGGDAAGDDAAVEEREVVGLHGAGTAAEGVGEELTGEIDVFAVAGDVGRMVGMIQLPFMTPATWLPWMVWSVYSDQEFARMIVPSFAPWTMTSMIF